MKNPNIVAHNDKVYVVGLTKENGMDVYKMTPPGQPKLFEDTVGMSEVVVQNLMRKLSGKIFTLLDASLTNEKQLKAIKDIIRNHISDTYGEMANLCYGNQYTDYCNEQAEMMTEEELSKLPEVSLEEAIGV